MLRMFSNPDVGRRAFLQLLFIRAYLEASEEDGSGDYRQGDAAERAAIEADLLKELAAYALASHFLWALWAVVQAQISGIKFGYLVRHAHRPSKSV